MKRSASFLPPVTQVETDIIYPSFFRQRISILAMLARAVPYKLCILVMLGILWPGCGNNYATSAGQSTAIHATSNTGGNSSGANEAVSEIFEQLSTKATDDMTGSGLEQQQAAGPMELNKMKPISKNNDSKDVLEEGMQDGGDEENKMSVSLSTLMRMAMLLLFLVLII